MRLWIFSSALVFVVWEREGTRDENDHRHSYSYCTCAEINFPEFDWLSDFQWHCMPFFRGWMHNYCLSLKKRALFSPSWSLFKTALSRSKARLRYWSFLTDACVLQLYYRPFCRFIRECFDAWRPFWIVRNVFPIIHNRLFPSYCSAVSLRNSRVKPCKWK